MPAPSAKAPSAPPAKPPRSAPAPVAVPDPREALPQNAASWKSTLAQLEEVLKDIPAPAEPKPNELVKQLNLVILKFEEIINSPKNLTIRLEK
jgi:hypothetical protein